ncbi:MAG: Hpt domain-containing protein [Victivallales bacterium]|nr:Hpt domain-containing protein [Victivallales bacterium]
MTIADLIAFGANTEEGMQRCLNNEAFYLRMVKKVPADASFQKLEDAIAAGDLNAAFDAAHTIKGMAANLALTPLLTPASELTELLRARQQIDYTSLLEAVRNARNALETICAQ